MYENVRIKEGKRELTENDRLFRRLTIQKKTIIDAVIVYKTKIEGKESWGNFFDNLKNVSEKYSIRITRLSISENGSGILEGRAKKQEDVVGFKNSLAENSNWKSVDLPLTGISITPGGEVGFSLNFSFEIKQESYVPR